jgi:hypothetical protein
VNEAVDKLNKIAMQCGEKEKKGEKERGKSKYLCLRLGARASSTQHRPWHCTMRIGAMQVGRL